MSEFFPFLGFSACSSLGSHPNGFAAAQVSHVVPFRHSKLTRIFQDHFLNFSRM